MCEIKNDLRLSKNGQKPLIYIEKSVVIYVFGESISTTPKRKVARSNRAGDAKTAVMRRLFRLLSAFSCHSFSKRHRLISFHCCQHCLAAMAWHFLRNCETVRPLRAFIKAVSQCLLY